jgi:hypothetical protein
LVIIFIGVVDWSQNIRHGVAAVIIFGAVAGAFFLTIMTFIGIPFPSVAISSSLFRIYLVLTYAKTVVMAVADNNLPYKSD